MAQNVSKWEQKANNPKNSNELRIENYDSLLNYYIYTNVDSAICHTHSYLDFSKKKELVDHEDYAYSVLGSMHRIKGNYDSAIYYNELAIEGYTKHDFPEGAVASYANLGNIYKQLSRYDLAIRIYFKAIEDIKSLGKETLLIDIYSNFAGLYFRLENYEKAEFYWTESHKLSYGIEKRKNDTYYYRGLARIYLETNQIDRVEEMIDKAFEIDNKTNNTFFLFDDYLLKLSYNSVKLVDKKTFLQVQQDLYQFRDIDNPINHSLAYEFSGDYYFGFKEYQNALIYYDSCIRVLEKYGEEDDYFVEMLSRVVTKKYHSLSLKGGASDLDELYLEMIELNKKANEIKKTYVAQELDAQYSLKEIEEEKAFLEQRNKVFEELNKKRRLQIVLLSTFLVFTALFIIVMFIYNRRIKRIQLQLEENVVEKEFLFKELNHRVKNNLFIVNSFIGIEKRNKSEEVSDILTKIENRIHSLGLMHEILYQGKMEESIALNSYFSKFIDSFKGSINERDIQISLHVDDAIRVGITKISYLGLVINELLTNSCKYAQKDNHILNITIEVTEKEEILYINYKDNGKGLPEDFDAESSLNLKIAKGLIKQIKGKLNTFSPEEGAEFQITIPNQL